MTTLDNATIAQVATCCNCCATAASEESNTYANPDDPLTFSSGAVMEQGDIIFLGPYSHVTAPGAMLDLVRENGSVESYLLPARDGSVKG